MSVLDTMYHPRSPRDSVGCDAISRPLVVVWHTFDGRSNGPLYCCHWSCSEATMRLMWYTSRALYIILQSFNIWYHISASKTLLFSAGCWTFCVAFLWITAIGFIPIRRYLMLYIICCLSYVTLNMTVPHSALLLQYFSVTCLSISYV